MKTPIIQKSIKRERLKIVKGLDKVDLIIFGINLVIALGLSSILFIWDQPVWVVGIAFVVIACILLLLLVKPRNQDFRIYYFIYLYIRFLLKNQKYELDSKNDPRTLFPYKSISKEEGIIICSSKDNKQKLLAGIEIKGFNFFNLNLNKQESIIEEFQNFLKFINCEASIIKLDQLSDFSDIQISIDNRLKKLNKLFEDKKISKKAWESRKKQLKGYSTDFFSEDFESDSQPTIQKKFYLILAHKDIKKLKFAIEDSISKLKRIGLKPHVLKYDSIINVLMAILNPYDEKINPSDIDQYSKELFDLFTLENAKFNNSNVQLNNDFYMNVSRIGMFPSIPNMAWLANLMQSESTVILKINPMEMKLASTLINKSITNMKVNRLSSKTKHYVSNAGQEKELDLMERLAIDVGAGNEILQDITVFIVNYGRNQKQLTGTLDLLKSFLQNEGFVIDNLQFRQQDAFVQMMPGSSIDISRMDFGREITAYSLAFSFPFINSDINDEEGLCLGTNLTGDLVIFDPFKINSSRMNSNSFIVGKSGSGKSTFVKKYINFNCAYGRKVFIIDPEREFESLCKYHDGNLVDCSGGENGIINPLQIYNVDLSEVNEEFSENQRRKIIQEHLLFLQNFFKILVPSLSDDELRYINIQLQGCYKMLDKYDLDNKIDYVKNPATYNPEIYPTFSDLLAFLIALEKEYFERKIPLHPCHARFREIIEYDFTGLGKYAQLYNGASKLNLSSNILNVFDILDIYKTGNKNVINAQMLLLFLYINNEILQNGLNDKDQEILIVVDEAHLIIDENNPVGLDFLYQTAKRIRKRKGGLVIVTQNLRDFFGTPEIIKKTTAIINNSQSSFVMKLTDEDIKQVHELYSEKGGLQREESNYLQNADKGEGVFFADDFERHSIKVKYSNLELEAMGNELSET